MGSKTFRKNVISGIAVANGFSLELGLSPLGVVAESVVELTPWLTYSFSEGVKAVLLLITLFDLLMGLGYSWEYSKWWGAVMFVSAFLGGQILIYKPEIGIVLIFVAHLGATFSPTTRYYGGSGF